MYDATIYDEAALMIQTPQLSQWYPCVQTLFPHPSPKKDWALCTQMVLFWQLQSVPFLFLYEQHGNHLSHFSFFCMNAVHSPVTFIYTVFILYSYFIYYMLLSLQYRQRRVEYSALVYMVLSLQIRNIKTCALHFVETPNYSSSDSSPLCSTPPANQLEPPPVPAPPATILWIEQQEKEELRPFFSPSSL